MKVLFSEAGGLSSVSHVEEISTGLRILSIFGIYIFFDFVNQPFEIYFFGKRREFVTIAGLAVEQNLPWPPGMVA